MDIALISGILSARDNEFAHGWSYADSGRREFGRSSGAN